MRVLVIEDEMPLARALRVGLTREGCHVDLAEDGERGIVLARRARYDVIVLDLMLPGMDGWEVCRQLRAAEIWAPVLVLTARDGEQDEADALDLGADSYLTEPFAPVVLHARLRALVRHRPSTLPVLLDAGDLHLDTGAHRVRRGATPVPLRPREFDLLRHLMEHTDETLTKDALLRAVWDEHAESDVNLVEVYVSSLRRKIDEPFGRSSIDTVHGHGYRFRGDGG